jgi:hypothetical protein
VIRDAVGLDTACLEAHHAPSLSDPEPYAIGLS